MLSHHHQWNCSPSKGLGCLTLGPFTLHQLTPPPNIVSAIRSTLSIILFLQSNQSHHPPPPPIILYQQSHHLPCHFISPVTCSHPTCFLHQTMSMCPDCDSGHGLRAAYKPCTDYSILIVRHPLPWTTETQQFLQHIKSERDLHLPLQDTLYQKLLKLYYILCKTNMYLCIFYKF
jgi:hypothetical protein